MAKRSTKNVVRIMKLKDSEDVDSEYWASKTPEERIAAMEVLRRQWYLIYNERPRRIQKVARIISLKEFREEKIRFDVEWEKLLKEYNRQSTKNKVPGAKNKK
ncbi:MAG: hypothetical protein HYZ34_00385 [Ignavibacteriae bacterium]|nr:hypothetical protein [Ignavibacteriota bacterium]